MQAIGSSALRIREPLKRSRFDETPTYYLHKIQSDERRQTLWRTITPDKLDYRVEELCSEVPIHQIGWDNSIYHDAKVKTYFCPFRAVRVGYILIRTIIGSK